jgi:hypothetical protein
MGLCGGEDRWAVPLSSAAFRAAKANERPQQKSTYSATVCPTHQHLGRRQERSAVEEARKSLGGWLSSLTIQHGEQPEHGGRLLEPDLVVTAVTCVPAKRGSPEARRFLREDQEGELEGFRESDVVELYGGGPGGEEVAVVER